MEMNRNNRIGIGFRVVDFTQNKPGEVSESGNDSSIIILGLYRTVGQEMYHFLSDRRYFGLTSYG